jgi:hypothetical protein
MAAEKKGKKLKLEDKKLNLLNVNRRLKVVESVLIELSKENADLTERLAALEQGKTKKVEPGINKIETFNGEKTPAPEDKMQMTHDNKIQSMVNAITFLPPNFVEDGRHSIENIQAIVGFNVSQELLDEVYSKHEHVGYEVRLVK